MESKREKEPGKKQKKPHILFPLLLRLLPVCKVHTLPRGGTDTLRPGNKTPVVMMMMMMEKEEKGSGVTADLMKLPHQSSVSCQGGSNVRKISVCLNKPLKSVSLTLS